MRNLSLLFLFSISNFFISCSNKTPKKENEVKSEVVKKEQEKLKQEMSKTNRAIDEINSEMKSRKDWNEIALIGYKTDLREASENLKESKKRSRELNINHRGLHIFGGGFLSYLTETSENLNNNSDEELYSEGIGYFFGLRYYGLGVEYRKVSQLSMRRKKVTYENDFETSSQFTDLEPFENSYEVLQYHWLIGLENREINGADGYFKIGVDQILKNDGYIYRKQESPFRPVIGLGFIWFSKYGIYLNMGVEASYWKQERKEDDFGDLEYDDSDIWEAQLRTEIGLW